MLYLGAIRQEEGNTAAAQVMFEEFVTSVRASGDVWRLASGLDILAELLRGKGDLAQADLLAEESRLLQQKLGKSLNLRQAWERMKRRGGPPKEQ